MHDLFLKFADEAQANSILYVHYPEVRTKEGHLISKARNAPNFTNIDIIGNISKPTAELDAEGKPIMQLLEGWHVNVRLLEGEDASVLEAYKILPNNPVRIWG